MHLFVFSDVDHLSLCMSSQGMAESGVFYTYLTLVNTAKVGETNDGDHHNFSAAVTSVNVRP